MSFIRVGGKHPPRKKKAVKPKPWDDTINDLDAYKATPDEIAYRRASHKSKHAVCTHLNRPGSARKGKRASPFRNNSNARKIAIMKEVLYDQKQLQEVLEKSDTMMAVVKDLFGDDPRRFAGIPSVTTAPNSKKTDIASSLVNLPSDIRTRTEDLSDSMMNQSALNELQDSGSDLDESHPAPLSYQPKMNMQRFQQFIEAEEKNTTLSTISGQAGMSHLGHTLASQLNSRNIQSSQLPDQTALTSKDGSFRTPPKDKKDLDESVEILRPPKSAMNDTNKISKTKPRVSKPEPEQNRSNLSLNELRKVLETLEDEVADYERQTGRRPPAERHRQESFSGYTLAIVDSVTKLTRYLKECELRLQAEITVREQLAQDVVQFKALVDALTSDIILTQEEFHNMATEFRRFRQETYSEIQRFKGGQPQLSEKGSPGQSVTSNPTEPVQTQTPPKAQQYEDMQNLPLKLPREINPFGDHLKPASAAVMLSPPVRRSRVVEPDRDTGKQSSLLDLQGYVSSVESNNSALHEDFAELPGLCTTSLAQVINPYNVPLKSQPEKEASQFPGSQPQVGTVSVNSVSVPKPTPLVQSNVGIPLPKESAGIPSLGSQHQIQLPQSFYEKNQPVTIKPQDRPQTFQRSQDQNSVMSSNQSECSEKSHGSVASGSDRDFLTSQIAELNKQHAEAQKRLNSLMHQQQAAQSQGQNDTASQQQIQLQQAQQQQSQQARQQQSQQARQQQSQQARQQQSQQARQQVIENQQRIQQQQQYEQQQRLIELVMQQQQRIQEQQQQQKRPQHLQEQQLVMQQNMQQPSQQLKMNRQQEMANGMHTVRESAELPGYRPLQKQPGLPAYPVSPNISPISQRSESHRNVYQSLDSQNASVNVPMGRGITVSLPKVDMDQSAGSPSPNPPQTAR